VTRILLVDDEPQVTNALRLMLRHSPYEVVVTNSSREAMTLAAGGAFDVVVSDMQMPDADGVDVLTAFRETAPSTMRIVLSGSASLEQTIASINEGAVFRFLTKPCGSEALLRTIAEAIAAREEKSERPSQPTELDASFASAQKTLWMATQPIVSVGGHNVVAYEALVRSREPKLPHGGAIMEAAEQLGRVRDIERQIRATLGDVARTMPAGKKLLVNLHPDALDDPELVSAASPLAPYSDSVIFEVTERARLKTGSAAWHALATLRERGHQIALDDLGAGYAGLNSLFSLKPDIVKIDMELVRNVHQSPPRAKLIASIVTVCDQLGMRVIAEGVETKEECACLVELGCDWLQGYFFARPAAPFADVAWP
jgi:EAL domain-containing protein (putative c-di-GMP-specific phosphodiesterase class I)